MSVKDPLQRLAVTSPCTQDWDSMTGNDRVRFCEHCSLHVHNISAMTRAEALRLAHRSHGRLCVRYHSTTQNPIVTSTPGSRRLHQIGRRISRLASGAFSATLSVSAVFAQPATAVRADNAVVSPAFDAKNFAANGGSLSGTVRDQNGAAIPGVTVDIINAQTQFQTQTSTNDAGEFRFDGLPAATYTVRLNSAAGFAPLEKTNVTVDGTQRVDLTMTMEVGQVVMVGGLAIPAPRHPFVKAAHDDDLDALRALIDDTNVNLRDPESRTTALEHAVRNANQEMVQFLIAQGADVNASEQDGHTALMQLGDDATPDLLWDLINAGAKINHKNLYGTTALMIVASQKNSEIVEELLAAGAEVNASDEDGKTALMLAASEGLVLNVRLLVLAGAKIDARDSEGKNALMHAIENEHRAVIRFLRSKGAVEVPLKEDEEN